MSTNKYDYFIEHFRGQLPIGETFDIIERYVEIGGTKGRVFFVDGLTDGEKCQFLFNFLMAVEHSTMARVSTSHDFAESVMPYLDIILEDDVDLAAKHLYSGMVAILLEGLDKIVIVDARAYPNRGIEEPSKEKTLRGARDGFTENFMDSVSLIRRRIRDNRLIFKAFIVGTQSKADVSLCYMKGIADGDLVAKVERGLMKLTTNSLAVTDQTVVEKLLAEMNGGKIKGKFNPFPKVRYTQRPDVVCAHISEGKLAIIVDNSPTVVLLPVSIFDFTQDMDDYYFPLVTGNYLRLLRIFNMLVILFISPIYMLIVEGYVPAPMNLDFVIPENSYALPIFWQFLLLEIAIDGLKLASLNTPDSLGMSLSVIGALILGQFSVDSGWLIPQTILVMAVVALASFTQPSIELSYGIKFVRIIMLVGSFVLGIWGFAVGLLLSILLIGFTKTISGHSYLFPLIPFKWSALKKLLFRTSN